MGFFISADTEKTLHASVIRADGRIYNLGRVDNKRWAPRAWWYRFVVYPRDRRHIGR